MSKTEGKESKPESKPAVFPEDTEFDLGANYDAISIEVFDPDPNMHYYLAANDGDSSRPDGAARVQSFQYRKSEKKHNCPDCVLMEIPRYVYEARQQARHKADMEAQNRAIKPAEPGLQPMVEGHGAFTK